MQYKEHQSFEYLPPEVLENEDGNKIFSKIKIWSIDVWGLGLVLLEIISGVPIWMPIRCKMTNAYGKAKVYDSIFRDSELMNDKQLVIQLQ